ncbi:Gfo/Idh/MocA family oxidoreductase [Candidatus Pelagibacter sp.]|nr:Gfo/Idh/MocA family oxidoreductase [Candidatus Pelagibacter sp.]MDC1030710.1 Gfo/Idh/MocA family oxidoreductase [Candidatus Pelagibacter sp.]
MKKINWGIIGLGSVAKVFVEGFNNTKNATLLGVASRTNDKVKIFKEKYQLKNNFCFNHYQDLIDQNQIDIIYLALPTPFHKEWIIKCLKNNKHVLVEKPAVMNLGEIFEVKKNLKYETNFFEAFMYLFQPQIIKTIELIQAKEIGELISMKTCFGNNLLTKKNWFGFIKKKKIDPNKRIFNKRLGGGAILDLGCYPVSFSTKIVSLCGNVNLKNVSLLNKKITFGPTEVDVDSYVDLKFDNGFISKIGASFSNNLGRSSEIIGTQGKIILEDTWTANPSKIILKKKNKDKIFEFKKNDNIYSYEIDELSKIILNPSIQNNLVTKIDETIINTKIIDSWKN